MKESGMDVAEEGWVVCLLHFGQRIDSSSSQPSWKCLGRRMVDIITALPENVTKNRLFIITAVLKMFRKKNSWHHHSPSGKRSGRSCSFLIAVFSTAVNIKNLLNNLEWQLPFRSAIGQYFWAECGNSFLLNDRTKHDCKTVQKNNKSVTLNHTVMLNSKRMTSELCGASATGN